jgi:transcriptional regulator with XRE-family HTH domain
MLANLQDKEYRDIFVSEQIDTAIPMQLRAMREREGWTQGELARRAGMAQPRISVMEDPNYSTFTISTLKRMASVFDVGLVVSFVPFSFLLDRFDRLAPDTIKVPRFSEDEGLDSKNSISTGEDKSNTTTEATTDDRATSAAEASQETAGNNKDNRVCIEDFLLGFPKKGAESALSLSGGQEGYGSNQELRGAIR